MKEEMQDFSQKLKDARTAEEVVDLVQQHGVEMPDDMLEQISAGAGVIASSQPSPIFHAGDCVRVKGNAKSRWRIDSLVGYKNSGGKIQSYFYYLLSLTGESPCQLPEWMLEKC